MFELVQCLQLSTSFGGLVFLQLLHSHGNSSNTVLRAINVPNAPVPRTSFFS